MSLEARFLGFYAFWGRPCFYLRFLGTPLRFLGTPLFLCVEIEKK